MESGCQTLLSTSSDRGRLPDSLDPGAARPTAVLVQEHRVIAQVLDALENLVDQAASTGTWDWAAFQDALTFLERFADGLHHHKEELILFPMLVRKGLRRQYGRAGIMVYEHNQGRRHARGMARALGSARQGDQAAIREFSRHLHAFLELLRRHIRKEDHCLFTWVDQAFNERERRELSASLEQAERDEDAAGARSSLLQLAAELVRRHSSGKGVAS